jgi:hypothetical protein
LPEHDGTSEARNPFELVLRGDVGDGDGSRGECEENGANTEGCGTTVCAPCLFTIHNETPEGKGDAEEDGEGGIADVAHIAHGGDESKLRVKGGKLGQRGDGGEWAKEEKDKLCLEAGRIHEGEEMNMGSLEYTYVIIGGWSELRNMTYLGEDGDHSIHEEPGS